MPQYVLHLASETVIAFSRANDGHAFAEVARELGIPFENDNVDEWRFYHAGAIRLVKDGVKIFPVEKNVFVPSIRERW